MKFKSSSIVDFMKILGQPPQLRILLVGTFKDCLLVEGRLKETKAKLKKRIELRKNPYYEHIILLCILYCKNKLYQYIMVIMVLVTE